ncbi:MAG: GNAT family N-acetyltransferase [Anaerolineales bacterium]|nr:GNAT family N-acetyltransferase [Anaerolineales bacterium]
MDLTIEPARIEDAAALTQIAVSAKRYWNYPERWIEIWIPALTITPIYISEHETWVAVVDEKPLGFYSLNKEDDSLWLDNLWILPEFMGQGIGRRLFRHALERSRALGASILKIESDPNAQSFYEKMGARKTGEHQSAVDGQARILPVMEINL